MQKDKALTLINTIVKVRNILTDEQALECKDIFPEWKVNMEYKQNERIIYNDVLYKVKEEHIASLDATPETDQLLYEII